MACMFCRFWVPEEPADHKAAREARTDHCISKWDQQGAFRYARAHRVYPDGWCVRHYPAQQQRAGGVCGDIELATEGWWLSHQHVIPHTVPQDKNLREWAHGALELAMNGTWSDRRLELLYADNKRLQHELAAARRVSRSRLERLQKAKPKPAKKPEPEAEIIEWAEAAE